MREEQNAKTVFMGVKPCKVTKEGPLYDGDELEKAMADGFALDPKFIKDKAKEVVKNNFAVAEEILDDGFKSYQIALKRYGDKITELEKLSKHGSESVRTSTEKLSQGLKRIESQSNFDKLERYCVLLERAAEAMTTLAELEKNGKLEKIINSLK